MAKQKNIPSEYRNFYMSPNFPLQFLSGGFWTISQDRPDRLHFHNCMEIGLCLRNRGEMEFHGKRYPYEEGDITVIPRNVPHSTWAYPDETSLWCYVMVDPYVMFGDILPESIENPGLSGYPLETQHYIFSRREYPELYELLQQVIEELKKQQGDYQIIVKALLLAFCMKVCRIEGAGEAKIPPPAQETYLADNRLSISPALTYIENHYMKQFTIEFLAELCHFSPTHFRRVFHETTGTSPLDYINTTRMRKACDLLRTTRDPILNISEAVGFHSVSSFNRLFIKIMKMSPREYRKQASVPSVRTQEK